MTEQNEQVISLRPIGGQLLVLDRKQVVSTERAGTSLMPPGLLTGLDEGQLKDLFSYLRSSQPLPGQR